MAPTPPPALRGFRRSVITLLFLTFPSHSGPGMPHPRLRVPPALISPPCPRAQRSVPQQSQQPSARSTARGPRPPPATGQFGNPRNPNTSKPGLSQAVRNYLKILNEKYSLLQAWTKRFIAAKFLLLASRCSCVKWIWTDYRHKRVRAFILGQNSSTSHEVFQVRHILKLWANLWLVQNTPSLFGVKATPWKVP